MNGCIRTYYTFDKTLTLDSGSQIYTDVALTSVCDDALIKYLLRLNWQYGCCSLALTLDISVAFEADALNRVSQVRCLGELPAMHRPEPLTGFIKNNTNDRKNPNHLYLNLSEKNGWPEFPPGPSASTARTADPGLVRFLLAHRDEERSFWYTNDVKIMYVPGMQGEAHMCFRHPDEDKPGSRLAAFDLPEERALFEQWRDMFFNGTLKYWAKDYADVRPADAFLPSRADSEVLGLIHQELMNLTQCRDGAVAADILQRHWAALVDPEKRSRVLNEFEREHPHDANTVAARILQMALAYLDHRDEEVLRQCRDTGLYQLGYQLATHLGNNALAYHFAAHYASRASGADVFALLLDVTRLTHNAQALCQWLGSMAENTVTPEESLAFFDMCYEPLRKLLEECGVGLTDEITLPPRRMDALHTIISLTEQATALGSLLSDAEAAALGAIRANCDVLIDSVLADAEDVLGRLVDVVSAHFSAEVMPLEQALQFTPAETAPDIDANAMQNSTDNPYRKLKRLIDSIITTAAASAGADSPAAPAAPAIHAAPAAPVSTVPTLTEQINSRFKQPDTSYRTPDESSDADMLPVLKTLLAQLSAATDLNAPRMPLLLYACLADRQDAAAAVTEYRDRLSSAALARRRQPSSDRRCRLCELMLQLMGGTAADMASADPRSNETPLLEAIQRRFAS